MPCHPLRRILALPVFNDPNECFCTCDNFLLNWSQVSCFFIQLENIKDIRGGKCVDSKRTIFRFLFVYCFALKGQVSLTTLFSVSSDFFIINSRNRWHLILQCCVNCISRHGTAPTYFSTVGFMAAGTHSKFFFTFLSCGLVIVTLLLCTGVHCVPIPQEFQKPHFQVSLD